MKAKLVCWAMIGLAVLAGCIPSLNAVYTDKDLVFDSHALGVWKQPGTTAKWEFTKRDDKSYRLVYTDAEGRQGIFRACLAKVEGTLLLDLYPEEVQMEASTFYQFHLVPIHTIYLVRRTEPEFELMAIDFQWLDKYLTDHPQEIACATFNGRRLITAPTADVQKFVLAHKDQFTSKFELHKEAKAN